MKLQGWVLAKSSQSKKCSCLYIDLDSSKWFFNSVICKAYPWFLTYGKTDTKLVNVSRNGYDQLTNLNNYMHIKRYKY